MSLIYCKCGCGRQREEFDTQGRRREYIRGHSSFNRHPTEEMKRKNSEWHKNRTGKNSPQYKGGQKLTDLRSHIKRRHGIFKSKPEFLNEWFEGSEGHHVNTNQIIFIPKELHRSLWHSIIKNINMEDINKKVNDWYINNYKRLQ